MKNQNCLTTDKHGFTRIPSIRHSMFAFFLLASIFHSPSSAFCGPTNNPTPATISVTTDTSGNLLAPGNFFGQNASNLAAALQAAATFQPASATLTNLSANNAVNLTNVQAGQLAGAHTLPDGTLSTNVPLLNAAQTFSGIVGLTNAGDTLVGIHSGSGVALTALNGSNIGSGTAGIGVGGTGATTGLLAASNVGTMFVGTGGHATALAATPNYTGQIIVSSFGETAGSYGIWLAGSTATGDVIQSWSVMGGLANAGSPYSESPYNPGSSFWYLNGNPANQLSNQSAGDAVVCFVNMNPWQSGSGVAATMVTTNAALAGGGAISTNAAGFKIYMRDQYAEYLYATGPETTANNAPNTVGLVANAHRQIFSEPTILGNSAQSNGNYIWIESIPYGDASGLDFGTHFPLLVSGVHDVTNTANVDTLYADQQNDFVSVHKSLFVGYTSYFTNTLIAFQLQC